MRLKTVLTAIFILGAGASTVSAASTASMSIYQLDSAWKTQTGKKIHLRELRGRPRIIAMFYSHCPYMCPRIVSDLKRLQKSLSPDARKRVGLVLVSIDPKRDSTTRLQTFAQEQGLDPSTWTLLSGNSGAVQELAAALGFKYRGSGKTFVHSYLISIIDSDGLIQTQLSQAGPAPQAVVQRINALK